MPIVDPEPWWRSERDARLCQLRNQIEHAHTDDERRTLRKEIRRARRDYRMALLHRYVARW